MLFGMQETAIYTKMRRSRDEDAKKLAVQRLLRIAASIRLKITWIYRSKKLMKQKLTGRSIRYIIGVEEGQKYRNVIRGDQCDAATCSAIAGRIPKDENSSYPASCRPAKESRTV